MRQTEDSAGHHYNYPEERITVPSWRFAHGPHVRAAFREVVADARKQWSKSKWLAKKLRSAEWLMRTVGFSPKPGAG